MLALFTQNPDGSSTLTVSSPTGTPLLSAYFRTPTAQAKVTRESAEDLPDDKIRAMVRAFASIGRAHEKGAIPAFVEASEISDVEAVEAVSDASESSGADSESAPAFVTNESENASEVTL